MNEITITIQGGVGAGKSCIMHAIQSLLRAQKIQCEIKDAGHEEVPYSMELTWPERIESLASRTSVSIIVKQ